MFFTTIAMALSIWHSCIHGGHWLLTLFLEMSRSPAWPISWHTDLQSLPSQRKEKAILWEEFSQLCPFGKGPLHSSEPVSALSCPSLSPLLLTDKAHLAGCGCTTTWSFCQMSLHSPFPGPGLFPSRSPWNGSERIHTDTGSWSPVECICKRGKFPFAFSLNI